MRIQEHVLVYRYMKTATARAIVAVGTLSVLRWDRSVALWLVVRLVAASIRSTSHSASSMEPSITLVSHTPVVAGL